MKTIFLTVLLAFTSVVMAQKAPKFKTIEIKTSALCGDCEERIENKLNYSKGVKFADLDLETKIVKVKFKTKKTNASKIKKLIASLGYHAGDVERNATAFDNLPGCCQDPNAACSNR